MNEVLFCSSYGQGGVNKGWRRSCPSRSFPDSFIILHNCICWVYCIISNAMRCNAVRRQEFVDCTYVKGSMVCIPSVEGVKGSMGGLELGGAHHDRVMMV